MAPCCPWIPKKRRLGPQNGSGSLGPEKLLKIVSCATIKETENAERDNCGGPNGIGGWPPHPPRSYRELGCEFQVSMSFINFFHL